MAESTVLPVYLVHWDAPTWCASAVESLTQSVGIAIEVTVVDNGVAGPPALSEVVPPGTRVISTPANRGYAGGANIALRDWAERHPDEPVAVVASHDLHVNPHTLARLVEVARATPDCGILGPRLTSPVTAAGGRWTGLRAYQLAPDADTGLVERDWVSGTCMLLRRACVDDVGGFDERLHSYVEDVDFCLSARDHGWRSMVLLDAEAYGLGSGGDGASASIARNSILVSAKRWGARGAVGALGLFVAWTAKGTLASVAPWRPKARRAISWAYASGRLRALRSLLGGTDLLEFTREGRGRHRRRPVSTVSSR